MGKTCVHGVELGTPCGPCSPESIETFEQKMRRLRGRAPLRCSECRAQVSKPYSRGLDDELHCSEQCYNAYLQRLVEKLSKSAHKSIDNFLDAMTPQKATREELERAVFGKPTIPSSIEDDSLDAMVYAMRNYESPPDDH